MGATEIKYLLISLIGVAMSLIGFVTVWIKLGVDKGRQNEIINGLVKKTEENSQHIAEIENKTHGLELRIAEFMGEIRVKIDYIKETVSDLKRGRHAAEK